ncbi:MAG: CAP domain-containing protein [Candidatus Doudnabacteria bacterium]|nr:CAP domain-containing protein [Candidatus Doudnabacteria bacterium]
MKYFQGLILLLIILTGYLSISLQTSRARASAIDSSSLMEKINAERTNRAIPPLNASTKLAAAAGAKTQDMFARGYFDHLDPDGKYVWPLVEAAGYKPYKILGENLAVDFSTEEGIVRAWINSPTHRDNLLRNDFLDQGLNAAYGTFQERYTALVTSLFGTLAVSAAPPVVTAPTTIAPPPPAPTKSQPTPVPLQASTTTSQSATTPSPSTNAFPDLGNENEPAIQLVNPEQTTMLPAFFPPSTEADFSAAVAEGNIFETVRLIFMGLVAVFVGTIIIDNVVHGRAKGLWENQKTGIFIALILVTIFTLNIY